MVTMEAALGMVVLVAMVLGIFVLVPLALAPVVLGGTYLLRRRSQATRVAVATVAPEQANLRIEEVEDEQPQTLETAETAETAETDRAPQPVLEQSVLEQPMAEVARAA